MSSKTYVLMRFNDSEAAFWTGKRWSAEYPDAIIFAEPPHRNEILKAGNRISCDDEMRLVADYGLTTEFSMEIA